MSGRVQLLDDGYYYVLQSFSFGYEIMNHYYPGEHYINITNFTDECNSGRIFDRIQQGGPFGLLPDLIKELHQQVFISSMHNAVYGMNMSEKDIVFMFLIRCDSYKKILDNFNNWAILKDLDGITQAYDVVEKFPKNVPLTQVKTKKNKTRPKQNFGHRQKS